MLSLCVDFFSVAPAGRVCIVRFRVLALPVLALFPFVTISLPVHSHFTLYGIPKVCVCVPFVYKVQSTQNRCIHSLPCRSRERLASPAPVFSGLPRAVWPQNRASEVYTMTGLHLGSSYKSYKNRAFSMRTANLLKPILLVVLAFYVIAMLFRLVQ